MMKSCVHIGMAVLLFGTTVAAATTSLQNLRIGAGPEAQILLALSWSPVSDASSTARVRPAVGSSGLVIVTAPVDVRVSPAQTATLQMTVQSAGLPTAEWFKVAAPEDIRMDATDPNLYMEVVTLQRATYKVAFSILCTDFHDTGQYYCRIHSSSGGVLDGPVVNLYVQGLVAHWTLDNADYRDGSHQDDVGGYAAVPEGTPMFDAGADGQIQGAVAIAARGGGARVASFDPTAGTGQMSLSFWARSSDTSAVARDLWVGEDPNQAVVTASARFKTDGAWQHICVVLDGTMARLYTNGILRGQGAYALSQSIAATLNIGSAGGGEAFFNGMLDDLRIYNMALNPTEVATLFETWMTVLEADDPGAVGVHDPCIIRQGDYVYVFCTGNGIPIRRSSDLFHWKSVGRVFATVPAWVKTAVPGVSNLWAPDVSYRNGRYYICYAASTFGSNTSCLGLVSNVTLDPADPNYLWVDEGMVINSNSASNYNAIDGNVLQDPEGQWWLSFGSFWTGIKLTRLDPNTGKPDTQPPVLASLADRPGHAIEAPFIVWRNGYYYLFPSYDSCCQGAGSTYNIRVGRSTAVNGPYSDAAGAALLQGGGTRLFEADPRWKGPGHCAVFHDKGQDYLVYHAYDALHKGRSVLRLRPFYWSADAWPHVGAALTEPVE